MAINILYVSANGTSKGAGNSDSPMDLKTAVEKGGSHSVIVLLNKAGPISTEGVALHKNQYLLGEGAQAEVFHSDGVTREVFTAPGSGGAMLYGTSKYNAVVGTHPHTTGAAVADVSATGGVNNAGMIAETRYHFILSGQSNMAGWANVSDYDKELQEVQDDVKIWTGGQFESLNPTTNSAPLDYGAAPSSLWAGSELSLGANLAKALGVEVFFTKVTAGGTAINRWINGDMNDLVLSHSLKASQTIAEQGYAPIMGGMAWNQGEYDMWAPDNYDQNLIEMLTQIQTAMGISDLKLIASGVSPQQGGAVIEQEILQAVEASAFIQYFSMLAFTEYSNGYNHFSAEAYAYMGYQFAVRLLENLMGNPIDKDNIDGYIPPRVRPTAPDANDDTLNIVIGLSEGEGNLLANDSDYNINDILQVSKINGNATNIGQWIALAEGGRIKVEADGHYIFDPMDDFNDLNIGETISLNLSYEVMDEEGLTSQAQIQIAVYGSNGRNGGEYIEANNTNTIGTNGDDVIYGTEGNDYIRSLEGFDMIFDYKGDNTIYASNNGYDDKTSQSVIFTGDGRDVIYATAGRDIIEAGGGNNTIYSYDGDDEMTTGNGDDYINARGRDWQNADKAGNKIIYTGGGRDTIYTGAGDDIITAKNGDKTIYTYGGNDKISVGDGNDYIYARGSRWYDADGSQSKSLNTGDGDDTIYTEAGDDVIITGDGNKYIYSAGGNDRIFVGDGNNYIEQGYNWQSGKDTVSYVTAGDGYNRIRNDAGDSHISAGHGGNEIYTYAGNDVVITGDGNDRIYLYGYNAAADRASQNIVSSGAGDDIIYTSYGQDIIDAGQGNDSIFAYYGRGHVFVFEKGDGRDVIYNFDIHEDKIKFNDTNLTFDDLNILQNGFTYIAYGDDYIALDIGGSEVNENMFLFA